MECWCCEKNNKCPIQKTFTEEEIGCSKGILTIKAQKELNAFQIIKKKRVNVGSFIKCCANINYEEYEKQWGNWHKNILYNLSQELLTKEEFDLLQEVLLCEQ